MKLKEGMYVRTKKGDFDRFITKNKFNETDNYYHNKTALTLNQSNHLQKFSDLDNLNYDFIKVNQKKTLFDRIGKKANELRLLYAFSSSEPTGRVPPLLSTLSIR